LKLKSRKSQAYDESDQLHRQPIIAQGVMADLSRPNTDPSASNHPGLDPLLTAKEAARVMNVSLSWLAKQRMSGDGPEFIRLGRAVRYSRRALQIWLAKNTRLSPS